MRNPTSRKRIQLIGASCDVGAGRRGGAMGPEALRIAGLEGALKRLGFEVADKGNLRGPAIAPGVAATVRGGPTYREAQLCMEMINDRGLMASLDVMELNPVFDHHNKTVELAVELIGSLFGAQILARAQGVGP